MYVPLQVRDDYDFFETRGAPFKSVLDITGVAEPGAATETAAALPNT